MDSSQAIEHIYVLDGNKLIREDKKVTMVVEWDGKTRYRTEVPRQGTTERRWVLSNEK